MPKISFERSLPNQQRQHYSAVQTQEQLLLFRGVKTQQDKNFLLNRLLVNNLSNKSCQELIDYCTKELKAISCLVEAQGNKATAKASLERVLGSSTNDDHINQILSLFENRNVGIISTQNITRTAAKYVEVLRLVLEQLKPHALATQLDYNEIRNLDLIRVESNKWYRGNYIKNVRVNKINNRLQIQLGRENGSMDYGCKLKPIEILDELINQTENPISPRDILIRELCEAKYSEKVKRRILGCYDKRKSTLNLSNRDLREVPNSKILRILAPYVTMFFLRNNKISKIESGSLAELSRLECLDLSYNQLSKLDDDVFKGLSELDILNLSDNQLCELDPDVFRGLSKLRELFLNRNLFEAIKANTFKWLPRLAVLMLLVNEPIKIHPEAFAGLIICFIFLDCDTYSANTLDPLLFEISRNQHLQAAVKFDRNVRIMERIIFGQYLANNDPNVQKLCQEYCLRLLLIDKLPEPEMLNKLARGFANGTISVESTKKGIDFFIKLVNTTNVPLADLLVNNLKYFVAYDSEKYLKDVLSQYILIRPLQLDEIEQLAGDQSIDLYKEYELNQIAKSLISADESFENISQDLYYNYVLNTLPYRSYGNILELMEKKNPLEPYRQKLQSVITYCQLQGLERDDNTTLNLFLVENKITKANVLISLQDMYYLNPHNIQGFSLEQFKVNYLTHNKYDALKDQLSLDYSVKNSDDIDCSELGVSLFNNLEQLKTNNNLSTEMEPILSDFIKTKIITLENLEKILADATIKLFLKEVDSQSLTLNHLESLIFPEYLQDLIRNKFTAANIVAGHINLLLKNTIDDNKFKLTAEQESKLKQICYQVATSPGNHITIPLEFKKKLMSAFNDFSLISCEDEKRLPNGEIEKTPAGDFMQVKNHLSEVFKKLSNEEEQLEKLPGLLVQKSEDLRFSKGSNELEPTLFSELNNLPSLKGKIKKHEVAYILGVVFMSMSSVNVLGCSDTAFARFRLLGAYWLSKSLYGNNEWEENEKQAVAKQIMTAILKNDECSGMITNMLYGAHGNQELRYIHLRVKSILQSKM